MQVLESVCAFEIHCLQRKLCDNPEKDTGWVTSVHPIKLPDKQLGGLTTVSYKITVVFEPDFPLTTCGSAGETFGIALIFELAQRVKSQCRVPKVA